MAFMPYGLQGVMSTASRWVMEEKSNRITLNDVTVSRVKCWKLRLLMPVICIMKTQRVICPMNDTMLLRIRMFWVVEVTGYPGVTVSVLMSVTRKLLWFSLSQVEPQATHVIESRN